MPNKHKKKKLFNKLLVSGKLNNKENVQNSRKYLENKLAIDQEGIDFDYEPPSGDGDFEKLDPSEDTPTSKKPKKAKKRAAAAPLTTTIATKKPKPAAQKPAVASGNGLPKKSKHNKYFFLAHPDALNKKEEILAGVDEKKFVIDEEKLKINKKKKKKPVISSQLESKSRPKPENKPGKKPASLWAIEECSSSDEAETNAANNEAAGPIIDLDDVDKSFKIKKVIKKLEDGSRIEVICPELVGRDEDEDDDDGNGDDTNENDIATQDQCDKEDEKKEDVVAAAAASDPFADKLKSSRFRFINEMLYTQPSQKSFEYFQK